MCLVARDSGCCEVFQCSLVTLFISPAFHSVCSNFDNFFDMDDLKASEKKAKEMEQKKENAKRKKRTSKKGVLNLTGDDNEENGDDVIETKGKGKGNGKGKRAVKAEAAVNVDDEGDKTGKGDGDNDTNGKGGSVDNDAIEDVVDDDGEDDTEEEVGPRTRRGKKRGPATKGAFSWCES